MTAHKPTRLVAVAARYGAQEATRALVLDGRHPSTKQLAATEQHHDEGDIDR
ncbi:hypothetical protein ABZ593_21185 [Streptomyces sp. NPDC012617]|uniref:hypothetical protein n=1 Tax=Streptomyces TaxID=1883 RepID=UPI0033D56F88